MDTTVSPQTPGDLIKVQNSKPHNSSTIYFSHTFKSLHHAGSIKHPNVYIPQKYINTPITKWGTYPVIVNSCIAHHVWTNFISFISYIEMKNLFVSMTNQHKVPMTGYGNMQILVNVFTLRIHDVHYCSANPVH